MEGGATLRPPSPASPLHELENHRFPNNTEVRYFFFFFKSSIFDASNSSESADSVRTGKFILFVKNDSYKCEKIDMISDKNVGGPHYSAAKVYLSAALTAVLSQIWFSTISNFEIRLLRVKIGKHEMHGMHRSLTQREMKNTFLYRLHFAIRNHHFWLIFETTYMSLVSLSRNMLLWKS